MRYVAFLRGMNVGGHRLTNAELCGHFEDLGFARVDLHRHLRVGLPEVIFGQGPVSLASSSFPAASSRRHLP